MRRMTREEIEGFLSPKGGYTRSGLAMLGVPWPPPPGWKLALLDGKPMPQSRPPGPRGAPGSKKQRQAALQAEKVTWDGTRIVVIDRSYPEAIAKARKNAELKGLPKEERRFIRSLEKQGL